MAQHPSEEEEEEEGMRLAPTWAGQLRALLQRVCGLLHKPRQQQAWACNAVQCIDLDVALWAHCVARWLCWSGVGGFAGVKGGHLLLPVSAAVMDLMPCGVTT
jgi:hypothetical protein